MKGFINSIWIRMIILKNKEFFSAYSKLELMNLDPRYSKVLIFLFCKEVKWFQSLPSTLCGLFLNQDNNIFLQKMKHSPNSNSYDSKSLFLSKVVCYYRWCHTSSSFRARGWNRPLGYQRFLTRRKRTWWSHTMLLKASSQKWHIVIFSHIFLEKKKAP